MAMPAARLGDTFTDGDTIAMGSGTVFVNGMPLARLGDLTTGHGPPPCFWPPVPIVAGSGSVFADGLPVARLGDPHATHCCGPACHDAVIAVGSGNVFIG